MNAIKTGVNAEDHVPSPASAEAELSELAAQRLIVEEIFGRYNGGDPEEVDRIEDDDFHFVCQITLGDRAKSSEWLAEQGVDLPALLAAPDSFKYVGCTGLQTLLYLCPEEARSKVCCWEIDDVGIRFDYHESRYFNWLARHARPENLHCYDWRIGLDWKSLPVLPTELLKVWVGLNDSGYPSEAPISDTSAWLPSSVPNSQQAKTLESADESPEPQSFDRRTAPAGVLFGPTDYVEAGFALVPVPRGMKGPQTPGWQLEENAIRTPEAAAALVGCDFGLAHRWSGTCAINIGDLELIMFLSAWGMHLSGLSCAKDAVRICTELPRRANLLFRLPVGCEWLPTLRIETLQLEFRCATPDGTGTVLDLLPPSINPHTGRPYQWGGSGDWRQLPTLPPNLFDFWKSLSQYAKDVPDASLPMSSPLCETDLGGEFWRAWDASRRDSGEVCIEAAVWAYLQTNRWPPVPSEEWGSLLLKFIRMPRTFVEDVP